MQTVSAVIPFYGEPEPVLELIQNLKTQQGIDPAQLEIIVSDDVSPVPFPETEGVKVVRRAQNGGFGSAVNSGVAAATGTWLFILNSDLELYPRFIADMLAAVEPLGDAMASPQIIGHDGAHQWVARKFPTAFHAAWEWATPLARFKPTAWWHKYVGHDVPACTATATTTTDWLMGACMVLPREVYNRVGGMDQRFYMNSEEVDLQYRLVQAGVPRYIVPEVVITHEGGGSSPSARRRQWLTTARFIYADKWGFEDRLERALKATTYLNFAVNSVRALRNPDVQARVALREELGYIAAAKRREN
ncbi:MAG: glycosyltransferase family 2 protein [Rothia sp. (in: high G+C Gram-positive bacteria)]|uniref:glycosyltransferase family 2 protein n=1 Tax=Rothia sp. (in: high G+C Gram-positive bacteria) TaxID=1885016 RepID=UPI0026DF217C|nr:glycosyltransferase family 2 protein [Rothia sp. (in: high G+C Gram-positive bacteria)]MDO5750271.1 glycosyltransferase family 2 protein [Rothia sp. (in: high G+C Gram-positive bacteria)]